MKIYTGYYGNWRKYAGLCMVAISSDRPRTPMSECRELAPKSYMVQQFKSGTMSQTVYTARYLTLLAQCESYERIIRKLVEISEQNGGKDLVLCCYEKPTEFCHRHLAAEWITRHGHFAVTEYV